MLEVPERVKMTEPPAQTVLVLALIVGKVGLLHCDEIVPPKTKRVKKEYKYFFI